MKFYFHARALGHIMKERCTMPDKFTQIKRLLIERLCPTKFQQTTNEPVQPIYLFCDNAESIV
jgi:hypothetical protein